MQLSKLSESRRLNRSLGTRKQTCLALHTKQSLSSEETAPVSDREEHHVSEGGVASTSGNPPMASVRPRVKSLYKQRHNHGPQSEQVNPAQVVNYAALFSREAELRLMPGLRVLATSFTGKKGFIPLHGGLPPADAFPLKGIQLTLKDGSTVDLSSPDEVATAQQYNLTLKGQAQLLEWVVHQTKLLHSPSVLHDTTVTSGSNYTLEILMRLFMNPGDSILCEEYTYPHMPESLVIPAGYKSVKMEMDEYGIIPRSLAASLELMANQGKKIPRLLYTIPVGQNPTGATQPPERKREIYLICRQYNIIILEDDPYYYLQYKVGQPPLGLKNLVMSYLSIDSDARVCRLDSFAKILAPGLRLGWLTAHPAVIEKVLFHLHGVAMGPCTLSQVVLGAVLRQMGPHGFERHIKDIQGQYARRAGLLMAAADKWLTGLADWQPVEAGMFLWIKLRHFEDTAQILTELESAKVIVVPGKLARHSGPNSPTPCPFVRLSFVTAPPEELEVAVQRFAGLLRKFQGQQKPPIPDLPDSPILLDQGEVV